MNYKKYSPEQIRFYKSKEWKAKRLEVLKRDHFECQRCAREGRHTRANTVHHIQHLNEAWNLRLTESNLISLCAACHNIEHPEKSFSPAKKIWDDEKF
ncbi:MAG: HNH endonuclease [Clostridia bacterium]|nr:HNH endonuclease [Clostridia bacterium]